MNETGTLASVGSKRLQDLPALIVLHGEATWLDHGAANPQSVSHGTAALSARARAPLVVHAPAASRRLKAERESAQQDEQTRRLQLEMAYEEHCRTRVAEHIRQLPAREYEGLIDAQLADLRKQWNRLPGATLREMAECRVASALRPTLRLPTLEQFARRGPQTTLFD